MRLNKVQQIFNVVQNRKNLMQKKTTRRIFFYLLVQFAKKDFCWIQNMLKGSLVVLNNVIWRFRMCIEIFFVFSY